MHDIALYKFPILLYQSACAAWFFVRGVPICVHSDSMITCVSNALAADSLVVYRIAAALHLPVENRT